VGVVAEVSSSIDFGSQRSADNYHSGDAMITHDRHRYLSRSLITVVVVVGLASGCYVGIDDEGFAEFGGEFGDEFGDADASETGESGDTGEADSTGDGDTGTTGDTTTDTGTTDTTDTGTTDTSTTDTDADTTDTDTSTTGDGDGDPMAGDMPDNAYCNPVSAWSAQSIALELEVIELVNQARAQGGNCGSEGNFPASGPLTWEPHLTCAARVHSRDMAVNDYFDHTNQQGNGPGWRLDQAGYVGGAWGENIAAGYGDPVAVVEGWLDSDGHCSNMLNPGFSLIGVGFYYDAGSSYGNYWTQTFGD
jgi:uncharacterized protein YkwD